MHAHSLREHVRDTRERHPSTPAHPTPRAPRDPRALRDLRATPATPVPIHLYPLPAPEPSTLDRPILAGIGAYLAFCVAMGVGFLNASDIWLHWVWAGCFFVGAIACTALIWGGSNRWLEPAGSLITTALCARPVGVAVEVLTDHPHPTPSRVFLTVVLYLGFALLTAIFFILAARLRED